MNRKVRTHTASVRLSPSKHGGPATDSLPKRPQTSLGFDRELSQINNILWKDSVKKKTKVVTDKPSDNNAFKTKISRPKVPPLKVVLEKFTKYEEAWERRRALSVIPKSPHTSSSNKYNELGRNDDSLHQTKLKNSEKNSRRDIKLSKKAWVQSTKEREIYAGHRNSVTPASTTSKELNTNKAERPMVTEDDNRSGGNEFATKNVDKSQQGLSGTSVRGQYSKSKVSQPISLPLSTVVEADDIERYIDDDDRITVSASSYSVSPPPLQHYKIQWDEEDYDTELEDEFPAPVIEKYDPSGRNAYIDSCKNQDVVPVSFVIKRLGTKELVMRHHGLGPSGTKPLAHALMKNTCVEVLDLTDNDLQSGGCFSIALMLYENFYITDLDLSENSLHADGGLSLTKVLISNTSLKRLVLRGNHLTDRAAKAFAEVLKENRTLLELDLSYNDIGESGGLFLGAGLALNYGLRTLNLSWNGIRNKGAVSMAAAFKTNDSLRCLNISWNGLAFVGALAFTRHLKKNDTLKELDISNNRISPKGAIRLSAAVAVNAGLQAFKIGLNPIGDEGVEAILNAAKKNLNIKFLGLEDITVSPKVHDEILKLERMRDIIILTGGRAGHTQEKPPPSGMEILIQFIQDNRLRLKDLFFQFDKDQSGDISREEFKAGLKETGIEMSEKQLDALIESIDIDNSNTIEYSEILYGREAVMKERRFQKKVAVRTEQREKESIRLPKLKGFED